MEQSRSTGQANSNLGAQAGDSEHQGHCPVCERSVSHRELFLHFDQAHSYAVAKAIAVIKAFHPGWSEDDGVCQQCWRSYGEAGRVLHSLRSPRPG